MEESTSSSLDGDLARVENECLVKAILAAPGPKLLIFAKDDLYLSAPTAEISRNFLTDASKAHMAALYENKVVYKTASLASIFSNATLAMVSSPSTKS